MDDSENKVFKDKGQKLRQHFLFLYNMDQVNFHENDVNNIKDKDSIIHRFLHYKNANVEEALKLMVSAMKWRKQIGVNQLTESSFPRELFQMGCIFTYGQDLNGAQIIVVRIKAHKRIGKWTDILKQFIVFLIERENIRFENNQNKGVCILADCTDLSISNVDLDILSLVMQTLLQYYPNLIKSVVAYQLPWLFQYFYRLAQSWLPKEQQEILHLVDKKEINKYIAESQLPDFMDGTNQTPYKFCPKESPTAKELAGSLSIKQKDVDRLLDHLEPYLNEN